jgi:hypothetical protein
VRSRRHRHRNRANGNDKVELGYKIADRELTKAKAAVYIKKEKALAKQGLVSKSEKKEQAKVCIAS